MSAFSDAVNAVEFDHAFTIVNGEIVDVPGVYVPSVYNSLISDVYIDGENWETLSDGWTGQYGYNGPVMHPSEYIGDYIADTLSDYAEDYRAFGITAVMDDEDPDNLIGWVILGLPA